jgi:uracil-DNA glycosylase
MTHQFCPGYPPPYDALVEDYPGDDVFPPDAFRVEWGPMFHRGRLDGTARVLVIGQDPAEEETFLRRILVGVAGQRTQGLLTKIGIDRSYVMINTLLYSVANQTGGNQHVSDAKIVAYRHQWLDTLAAHNELEAIVTLGTLAKQAYTTWHATPTGQQCTAAQFAITHPTADGHTGDTAALLANWNTALPGFHAAVSHPDHHRQLKLYGTNFAAGDLTTIPEADLPPGLPAWTHTLEPWAQRGPGTGDARRATLTLTVPNDQRVWMSP